EEALSMSDRVIVMNGGKIQQAGAPKELYRNPANHFVADFVGRASFFEVTRVEGGRGWRTPSGELIEAGETPQTGSGCYQAMLRPEDIDIVEGDAACGEPGRSLSGTIRESHYLGAFTEYMVDAGGARLKVHSKRDLAVGASVTLRFAPENCRLIS